MSFLNSIGTPEIIIIGIVLLVLFGGKRLSQWAKGLGETGHELKKIKKDFTTALEPHVEDEKLERVKPEKREGVE